MFAGFNLSIDETVFLGEMFYCWMEKLPPWTSQNLFSKRR